MENKSTELQMKDGASPAEMILSAVKGGADLEKLEKLLALQERWEANEARKAYYEAMAAFKANPPKIEKDKSVSFGPGKASYKHASLANVCEKINSRLSEHGLSASWRVAQNGTISVTTRISHSRGHFEETTLTAPSDKSGSKNDIQAIGSTVTYLQRYGLLSLAGLAAEDQDDDGKISNDPVIDEKQLGQLRDWIIATSTNEDKFLKYLGIEDLAELPKSQFQKAINALESKKAKVSK